MTALWAIFHAWRGLLTRAAWTPGNNRPGLVFTSLLNTQVLLGLIVYCVSPLMGPVFDAAASGPGTGRRVLRPGSSGHHVLHGSVRTGRLLDRQAGRVDRVRYPWTALGYTLALVLIFAAIPWPWMNHARPLLRGLSG